MYTPNVKPVDVRRLKDKGRTFREAFLAKLALLLRGTVAAPPERFGETLADEHIRGGAPMQIPLECHTSESCVLGLHTGMTPITL